MYPHQRHTTISPGTAGHPWILPELLCAVSPHRPLLHLPAVMNPTPATISTPCTIRDDPELCERSKGRCRMDFGLGNQIEPHRYPPTLIKPCHLGASVAYRVFTYKTQPGVDRRQCYALRPGAVLLIPDRRQCSALRPEAVLIIPNRRLSIRPRPRAPRTHRGGAILPVSRTQLTNAHEPGSA